MRAIKFRAFHKQQKVMTYKPPFQLYDGVLDWANHWETMQFTGFVDKNRREIYEGDIVALNDTDNPFRAIVVFHQGAFKLQVPLPHYEPFYQSNFEIYEIIGNIYEQPELLQKAGNT